MICTMSLQLGVCGHLGLHIRLGNVCWSHYKAHCAQPPAELIPLFPPIMSKQVYV